jgi:hypothetical protein
MIFSQKFWKVANSRPTIPALLFTTMFAVGFSAKAQTYNFWKTSHSGSGPWTNINSSKFSIKDLRFGDFDGNGKYDVFASWGGQWNVSYDGTGPWTYLNSSNLGVDDVALGDFDGDGKTDVFAAWDGFWRISFGGVTGWQIVNGSSFGLSKLRFGDFNGDGKTDVFAAWDGHWHVSYSATSLWKTINTSNLGIDDIWLGDFNGDGKSDVFAPWGGHWHISYSGTGAWQTVNGSSFELGNLRFGDLNGGGTDVIATWGGHLHVSYNATSAWQQINSAPIDVSEMRFADFDGDHKDDAFVAVPNVKPIELTIRRHVKTILNQDEADSILDGATSVLQTNDGPGDEACMVKFERAGPIGTFDIGDGYINTPEDWNAIVAIQGQVKVVNAINYCPTKGGYVSTSGCTSADGKSEVVARWASNLEGILWAHEYGHTRGLLDRSDPTALMSPDISSNSRRVNHTECLAFQK